MDEHRSGGIKVWLPLLFALIMIFGMTLGFNLRDSLRNKRDIQAIIERNDRLEEIIDLVNAKYVDSVNSNLLYRDAVSGILSHLDPHTVYISSDELQGVNEDLEGSFFGIGVEFAIVRDTIEVTSVVENGPAEHAGLEVGDKLLKVNDSTVAGTGITSDRIIKMLRGKQHSRVSLLIKDAGNSMTKEVPIERDIVPLYSIDASFMLDNETGFIKINRFSATTFDEFMKALKSLKDKGMKQLVLDLRDNPGGYLDAATRIADQFLDDEKLIVYTQGRTSSRIEYKAGESGLFEHGKLVVLIDENSASASEILSGAIQDWDRGLIIGRRSFGKGLVQEQYDLDDGAALRLTVARYYTPSGRSIQRSFAKGKDAYAHDFEDRFKSGELTGKDSAYTADSKPYYTSRHRTVYGGGGIKPDVYVPYDTTRLGSKILNIVFSSEMKTVLWDYYINHSARLRTFKTISDFSAGFSGTEDLERSYLATLKPQEKVVAAKLLAGAPGRDYFRLQAKAQLARILFRNNGYYMILSKEDNVVQKALEMLAGKQFLQLIGG
ncbi:S41 family peptidase [Chitinophagaceae bacterium MMS25-I14]